MLSLSYTFFEAVFCNSLFEDSTIFFFLQVRGKRVPQSKSSIKRAIEDSIEDSVHDEVHLKGQYLNSCPT